MTPIKDALSRAGLCIDISNLPMGKTELRHENVDGVKCQISSLRLEEVLDIEELVLRGTEEYPGLLNHPTRITVNNISGSEKELTRLMIKFLHESKYYGPYCIIYGGSVDENLKSRLREAESSISEVIFSEKLYRNERVIFQLTPDVIRLITDGNKVLGLQLRIDFYGCVGVLHQLPVGDVLA